MQSPLPLPHTENEDPVRVRVPCNGQRKQPPALLFPRAAPSPEFAGRASCGTLARVVEVVVVVVGATVVVVAMRIASTELALRQRK